MAEKASFSAHFTVHFRSVFFPLRPRGYLPLRHPPRKSTEFVDLGGLSSRFQHIGSIPVLPVEKKTTKQHHSEKQAIRTAAQGSRGSTVPPSPCWKQEKQCQGWHSFAPSVSPPQCRRCEPHQQMRQEQRETHKCQPEISRVAMTQVD